jgi:hypothetical protein
MMTPNDKTHPYICYSLSDLSSRADSLSSRRKQIVDLFCQVTSESPLENNHQENLARFNALILITGSLLATMIEDDHSGKRLWELYSHGVQQVVNYWMMEDN